MQLNAIWVRENLGTRLPPRSETLAVCAEEFVHCSRTGTARALIIVRSDPRAQVAPLVALRIFNGKTICTVEQFGPATTRSL